jgi:hypothetical protein
MGMTPLQTLPHKAGLRGETYSDTEILGGHVS